MTQKEIDAQISELKAKIKELENTKPQPVYRSWEDLIEESHEYKHFDLYASNYKYLQVYDVFLPVISQKIAKKILATGKLALLMQLPEYNGDWKPDYSDNTQCKYCIINLKNNFERNNFTNKYQFLAFKTKEIRDAFLNINIELIKDYFELD